MGAERGGGAGRGRDCGIGEEGWDAVLCGTVHAAVSSLARLRARPVYQQWRMHWPALHAHPLAFSDDIEVVFVCDAKMGGCLRGFRESRLGFRSTQNRYWAVCLACAADTNANAAPSE